MRTIVVCCISAALALTAGATNEIIRMPATPSLSPDGSQLAFEWRGDIWIAASTGGVARPLTSHPAAESRPAFSPDGREVAFLSERDDAWQVYVAPAAGGLPERLTSHTEGYLSVRWFPDGRTLLARAVRDATGFDNDRLYRICRAGRGPEQALFDDYCGDADISPDGTRLLFTREGSDLYRQGYRGSGASQIWLYELGTKAFKLICGGDGWDHRLPAWKPDGRGFYWVSGRDGCANVREKDLESGAERALTSFTNGPVTAMTVSRDGGTMVLRQLFDFQRIDLAGGGAPLPVALEATSDTRPPRDTRRWYKTAWNLDDWGTVDFTRDGLEMVFTTGGDVWVMDTVLKEPRQVTRGTLEHDREAVFNADASAILFLRDDGLGVNLWRARRTKADQPWWQGGAFDLWRRVDKGERGSWWQHDSFELEPLTADRVVRARLTVSPDGSKIAWVAGRGDLVVAGRDGENPRTVMSSPLRMEYHWSPDGRWLACAQSDSDGNSDVWIASSDGSTPPYNLSRHPGFDSNPCWSPDGRVVAFTGRTYDDVTSICYVWLAKADEDRSRRERKMEEAVKAIEEARNGGKNGAKKDAKPAKAGDAAKTPEVKIDFDRLFDRIHRIAFAGCVPDNLFWSFDAKALAFSGVINGKRGTYRVNFPEPGEASLITEKVGVQAKWIEKNSRILWMLDGVPAALNDPYAFEAFHYFDATEHQRLGFRLCWRAFRDRFYDGRLNGRDWEAVRLKYEDAAAGAADPSAFGRIVYMMMGELNSSHIEFRPERRSWNSGLWKQRTAHLGLRFDPSWPGPGLKVRDVLPGGPADEAGSRIAVGEVVRRIDGVEVGPDMDLTQVLNGKFPRDVLVDVADAAGKERRVTLPTIGYDEARGMVRRMWIEHNRTAVSTLSSNRLGYINIERMQLPNLRQFEREVYAEGFGKDGLMIDVRNNPGGFISDHLLSILCHPRHATTVPRGGEPSYPTDYVGEAAWDKPIVVLCNQKSGSNSEIFSHAIKALGRGKLVGVPTQGAVISTPEVRILDLGTMNIPHRGWFTRDGQDMELNGAVPDYVVWPMPGEIPAGKDRQLEKGVEVLLEEVAAAQARPVPPLIRASERSAPLPHSCSPGPGP